MPQAHHGYLWLQNFAHVAATCWRTSSPPSALAHETHLHFSSELQYSSYTVFPAKLPSRPPLPKTTTHLLTLGTAQLQRVLFTKTTTWLVHPEVVRCGGLASLRVLGSTFVFSLTTLYIPLWEFFLDPVYFLTSLFQLSIVGWQAAPKYNGLK